MSSKVGSAGSAISNIAHFIKYKHPEINEEQLSTLQTQLADLLVGASPLTAGSLRDILHGTRGSDAGKEHAERVSDRLAYARLKKTATRKTIQLTKTMLQALAMAMVQLALIRRVR